MTAARFCFWWLANFIGTALLVARCWANWHYAYAEGVFYSAYLVGQGATPLEAHSLVLARACRRVPFCQFRLEATPEILGALKVSNREVKLLDGSLRLVGGNWEFTPKLS